jgi:hypothetical protein
MLLDAPWRCCQGPQGCLKEPQGTSQGSEHAPWCDLLYKEIFLVQGRQARSLPWLHTFEPFLPFFELVFVTFVTFFVLLYITVCEILVQGAQGDRKVDQVKTSNISWK